MSNGTLEAFALTERQTALMYSFQREKILNDIENEKKSANKALKKEWLNDWEESIKKAYSEISSGSPLVFSEHLNVDIGSEINHSESKTWYYLIVLETEFFVPYFPLDGKDKRYKHIKYTAKDFVYNAVKEKGTISPEFVTRINKAYTKTYNKLNGTTGKIVTGAVSAIAVTALSFGLAAAFAGPIAVALVGSEFAGLSGAALTSASLAYIGGGAIAAGGLGMAGGTMFIAGGGAILGLAAGGSISGLTAAITKNPKLALSLAAKLEVVMKEIILNAQHDVVSAQKALAQYKEKIKSLEDEIEQLKISDAQNKKDIKNMEQTLEYFKKSYIETNTFTSSFDIGMKHSS